MAEDDQYAAVVPISFIWLDDSVESRSDTRGTAKDIQKLVNGQLKTFVDSDECVHYMISDVTEQRIVLIISNKLGPNVVPLIYNLTQIETIYVYCGNRSIAEQWAKAELKVGNIFTKKDLLLAQIRDDVYKFTADDVIPISAFQLQEKENSLQKLSPGSAKFIWYQVTMSVLLLMARHFSPQKEMVDEAIAYYHKNKAQKEKIYEFAETYQEGNVLLWYTSDTFVYRLLNKALRSQNTDIIFKFRLFISHLHNQINQLYQQYLATHQGGQLTVYRAQMMSMEEIEFLAKNVNGIIAMNTFLSTTQLLNVVEMYLNPNGPSRDNPHEQAVLFTIHISDINQDTTPFAFISRYSCIPDEAEVLFTINALFSVQSVTKNGNIWHVCLQLSKQQNQQQKDFSQYMMNAIGPEPSPTVFGWFLFRMNDFDKAERYAHYIIQQPIEETEKAAAYNLLGLIYKDRKNYEKAVEFYKQAIDFYDNSERFGSSQIIAIHHNLSLAYLAADDIRLAEDHRRIADRLLNGAYVEKDPLLIGMSKSLEGKLAVACGEYPKALENLERALQEKKKTLPLTRQSIAALIHEMGVIHEKMNDDTKALRCFEEAADMNEKSLTIDYLELGECLADAARIRYKRREYEAALKQFEKALKIITSATVEDLDIITEILKCIKDIKDIVDPLPPPAESK